MRRIIALLAVGLGLVLCFTACGTSRNGSTGDAGSAVTAHRVEHQTGLTYESGTDDQHERITTPSPRNDFPDSAKLSCTTTGAPAASGTIKNTTGSLNDYNLEVQFFDAARPNTGEEIARTYVQVYGVAPSETVPYSTAETDGESHPLTGNTVCQAVLFERARS